VPRVVSFIVLVGILLFIASMFFKVMAQFILPLFLAAVLVVVFKPLHMWVREQLPGRLRISALVTTCLIMLVVLLPTGWLGWNAFIEGKGVFNYLKDRENRDQLIGKIEAELRPILDFYAQLSGRREDRPGSRVPTDDDLAPEVDAATDVAAAPRVADESKQFSATAIYDRAAAAIGGFLLDIVKGMLRLFIGLIIMVLALYYFLVDGPSMIHTMMRLSPLENEYERELLDKFANVSRSVVLAVLISAIAQGVLAGLGFYFALDSGAPIFLLTMITMVAAVVPFVGAAGIWIPTAIWIYMYQGVRTVVVDGQAQEVTGDPVAAIGLAIYCGCIVSTIDNVIKPLVLHGQSNLHPLLALMSVLGGVTALGPVGILVGPMLVAFVHALLVMVNKELRLLGSPDMKEVRYDNAGLPIHPATELEAEAAAGGGLLARLAGDDRAKGPAAPSAPAAPPGSPPPPAKGKRGRRRK
jgi:predicted PurR-regulated permease PerM